DREARVAVLEIHAEEPRLLLGLRLGLLGRRLLLRRGLLRGLLGGRLLAGLAAELHLHLALPAVAVARQRALVAVLLPPELLRERGRRIDLLALELDDDVAGLQARLRRRRAFLHLLDLRAARRLVVFEDVDAEEPALLFIRGHLEARAALRGRDRGRRARRA